MKITKKDRKFLENLIHGVIKSEIEKYKEQAWLEHSNSIKRGLEAKKIRKNN